jgi:ribosome modulation factor
MMNELNALLPHLKFRFHVDNPTLEECYAYGYECALADIREEENPYQLNSQEQEQWLEGWWAGFYHDQPLFSLELEHADDESRTLSPVNDAVYHAGHDNYFLRVLEIAGVIAVSAIIGYQVIDIVA